MGGEPLLVSFGAITSITFPAVVRVLSRQILHDVITVNLGNDRGGGDGEALAIAFYKELGRQADLGVLVTIDEEGLGLNR